MRRFDKHDDMPKYAHSMGRILASKKQLHLRVQLMPATDVTYQNSVINVYVCLAELVANGVLIT